MLHACTLLRVANATRTFYVYFQVAMEAEVVSATRQLELLKEGYSKARDNLRAEQSVSATP